jgi:putative RecB family exonuclease
LSARCPTLPRVNEIPAASLSPSRAADFMTCPLLYRFRVIDRLPEPPSPAAARGTLVHAVLERLFDQPAASRSPEAAAALLEPEWERLVAVEPELADLFGDTGARAAWLAQARAMLDRYFTLEDPTRLEPAHRELPVEAVLGSGLRLRGYIDRIDISPGGDVRIVDYKTGTAPREDFEARALFQMRFYALVLFRAQGTLPKLLQLMYLGNGEIMRYAPDAADLAATERKIEALWRAIERATAARDWRHRPSKLCDWCAHQVRCPAFGGTPPPLPAEPVQQAPAAEPAGHLPAASAGQAPAVESARQAPAAEPAEHAPSAVPDGQAPPVSAGQVPPAEPAAATRPSVPAQPAARPAQPAAVGEPVMTPAAAHLADPLG